MSKKSTSHDLLVMWMDLNRAVAGADRSRGNREGSEIVPWTGHLCSSETKQTSKSSVGATSLGNLPEGDLTIARQFTAGCRVHFE